MHELREVVCEASAVSDVIRQRCVRYHVQVDKESSRQRGDERGGGSQPRFVHIGKLHARWTERGDAGERFNSSWKA